MGKYDFDDDDDDDFFNDKPKDRNPRNNPMPSLKYDPAAALRSVKTGIPPGQPLISEAVRMKRYKDDNGFSYQDENLDDNFENTPFVPPNVTRANDYKWTKIYKGARYDFINMTTTNDMSSGVNLHFLFLKTMSIGLFFMFLCSIPTLIFCFSGQGMLVTEYDLLHLDHFTIGNIGNEDSLGTYQCEPSAYATSNDTCITVMGSYHVPLSQISLVVTIMEVIQVLVFLITVCALSCGTDRLMEAKAAKEMTSATDFTVLVSNLPRDTTEKELIQHFSDLYQLEKVDFKGRLPVEEARPVQFCDNSGDPTHVGTWVAECVIHKKNRPFIMAGRKLVQMLERLYFLKAKMKMHDLRSPYTKFISKELKEKAEAEMIAYADTIDRFIERKNVQFGIGQPPPPMKEKPPQEEKKEEEKAMEVGEKGDEKKEETVPEEPGKNNINKKKGTKSALKTPAPAPVVAQPPPAAAAGAASLDQDLEKALHAEVPFSKVITKPHKFNKFRATCAFVCFEYNESFARCVEDYRWYNTFPVSLFMPKKLYFKGTRLSIRKAPKPHQIVWENIDILTPLKLLLKIRTALVGLALIAVSLAVLLYAAHQRNLFTNVNATITDDICTRLVPEVYTSVAGLKYDANLVSGMKYTRPEAAYAKLYDPQCDALIPGSFFMKFQALPLTGDGHVPYDVGEYKFEACANQSVSSTEVYVTNGLACPAFNQSTYCPCVTTFLDTGCESKACAVEGETDPDCVHYTAGDIGTCYCTSVLAGGVSSIMSYLSLLMGAQATGSPDLVMCDPFNFYWSKSEAVLYVAIVVTSIVQAILRRTVAHLVRLECHVFKDDLHRALFFKTFIATYLNLAVAILGAYGNAVGKPAILTFLNVFNGPYYDFVPDWYGSVGFFIIMTYFSNIALTVAFQFLKYYLGIYLYTFKPYYQVDLGSSQTILVQHQLDVMEVGAVFDVSVNSAQNLARIFIMMTFAPGIPLMTLVCLVGLVIHFCTDKFMISFYNEKPKFLSNAVMKCVLSLLPYAAMLRLCVGGWMFGADRVLLPTFDPVEGASANAGGVNTNIISLYNYMQFVDSLTGKHYLPSSIQFLYDRAVRGNVLPLMVFLVLIILVKIIRKIVPFGLIGRGISYLFKRMCGAKTQKIVKAKGFLHPYELVMSKHPLRREAAPYTGSYFRYIPLEERLHQEGGDGKGCLGCFKKLTHCSCCKRKSKHHELSLLERMGEDWEECNVNNFECYVKVWPATAKTLDGSTKMKGDHKKTYEVVRDNGSFSYDLEKIPGYSLMIIAWKEFTPNPVLHDFFKRHPEKNPEAVRAKEKAEEEARKAEAELRKTIDKSLHDAHAAAAIAAAENGGEEGESTKKKKKKLLPPGGAAAAEQQPETEAAAGPSVVEEIKPEPKKGFFERMFGKNRSKNGATGGLAPGAVLPVANEVTNDPLNEHVSGKVKAKPSGASAKGRNNNSNNNQEDEASGSESSSSSGSGSGSDSGSGSGSSSGSESGSGSSSGSESDGE